MTADSPTIRLATPADARAIDEIYAHYVLTSTCTFQREVDPPGVREAWLSEHDEQHPVIVVEQGRELVAWGCLSSFRTRWGYRFTVESSVYVRHDMHRRGLGELVMRDLIERAEALGHHTILASVTADQAPSLALHERLGFREVARMPEIGHKMGRWLDVVYLQKMLPPR